MITFRHTTWSVGGSRDRDRAAKILELMARLGPLLNPDQQPNVFTLSPGNAAVVVRASSNNQSVSAAPASVDYDYRAKVWTAAFVDTEHALLFPPDLLRQPHCELSRQLLEDFTRLVRAAIRQHSRRLEPHDDLNAHCLDQVARS